MKITDELIDAIAKYVNEYTTVSRQEGQTLHINTRYAPAIIRELIEAELAKQQPGRVLTDGEIDIKTSELHGGFAYSIERGRALARWAIAESYPDYAAMEERIEELCDLVSFWQMAVDDSEETADWEFGDVRWRNRLHERMQKKDDRIADLEKQLAEQKVCGPTAEEVWHEAVICFNIGGKYFPAFSKWFNSGIKPVAEVEAPLKKWIKELETKLAKAEQFIYALDPCPKCWTGDTDSEHCTCTTAARDVNAESELAEAKKQIAGLNRLVEACRKLQEATVAGAKTRIADLEKQLAEKQAVP